MSSFKEFWDDSLKNNNNRLKLPLSTASVEITKTLQSIYITEFENYKKENFCKDLINYIGNDNFISELSEKIKTPKENESENEFVERASDILRRMLEKKFGIG